MTPIRSCPPCDSRCRQGRDCPARRSGVERLADDEHPLGFFIGLRNAFAITAAAFALMALAAWLLP